MCYLKMSFKGSVLLILRFFFPPLPIFYYLFSQQLTSQNLSYMIWFQIRKVYQGYDASLPIAEMHMETFLYISTWFLQKRMEFLALTVFGINRK